MRAALFPLDRRTTCRIVGCAVVLCGVAIGPCIARSKVYKCIDPKTHAVTLSQTECPDTRSPSPAEIAAIAEAARIKKVEDVARQAAERDDRQLLEQFPDEPSHRAAESAELAVVIGNIRKTLQRFDQLVAQRRPLEVQAAFYVGKPLPLTLRRAIDDNDGSFAGLVDAFRGHQRNVDDVVARYATQRERLRRLWAGASAGSMGPLDAASASTPAK